MKSVSSQEAKKALEAIRDKSPDKMLHPEEVVKAAKKATHPLHSLFTWDDGKAAEQWRLMQARMIIRKIKVTNPEDVSRPPTPVYVSLNKDKSSGGGYRRSEDIVGDEELREALRDTAVAELRGWIKRYRSLLDLAGILDEAVGLEESLSV